MKLLIVENDLAVAFFFEVMANEIGYDVIGPAHDLDSAMELSRRSEIDIGLLDIYLDGAQTSLPVAGLLRDRGIPFIFTSGYIDVSMRADFEDVPVLKKPFTYAQFTDVVARLPRRLIAADKHEL